MIRSDTIQWEWAVIGKDGHLWVVAIRLSNPDTQNIREPPPLAGMFEVFVRKPGHNGPVNMSVSRASVEDAERAADGLKTRLETEGPWW